MAEEDDTQDADYWRRRYRQQIDEVDRIESQWQASDTALRRALLRFGRLATGYGEAVDDAVDALHASIRAEAPVDELAGQIDRLANALVDDNASSDDNPPRHDIAASDAHDASRRGVYLDLVHRLRSTTGDASLDELRHRLERARTDAELDATIQNLVQWLALDTSAGAPAPHDESVATNTEPVDESLYPAAPLLDLVERITVPPVFEDARAELLARLQSEPGTAETGDATANVASLINDIRVYLENRQQEVQEFLGHVTGRVEQLGILLSDQSTTLGDEVERGRVFNVDLTEYLDSLRTDIGEASGLEQIKDAVDERLDTMASRISEHREAQQATLERARSTLQHMNTRVGELEREAHELRNALRAKDTEALTDALTGLPNRKAYDQRIAEEFQRWQRFGTHLTLVLFDIDHFKHINDTYGHRAGDNALHVIAQLLSGGLRRIDFLARYGGEEFVALLPGAMEDGSRTVVDRLLTRVFESQFHYHGEPVTISLSAGVTPFGMDDTIESVVDRADQALYAAKEAGRNQCVVRPPPEAAE